MSLVPSLPDLSGNPSTIRHGESGLSGPGPDSARLWRQRCCSGVRLHGLAEALLQRGGTRRELEFVLAGAKPAVGPFLGEWPCLAEHDRHRRELRLDLSQLLGSS